MVPRSIKIDELTAWRLMPGWFCVLQEKHTTKRYRLQKTTETQLYDQVWYRAHSGISRYAQQARECASLLFELRMLSPAQNT
jgi:hypothetical protein